MRNVKQLAVFFVWLFVFCLTPRHLEAADWLTLAGAVHVHTSEFSSGAHTLSELVSMAGERGVDVIVLNDHERVSMSYGVPPFRNLFSLSVSRNSVLKRGAREYLDTVDRVDRLHPEIVIVPGLETAPYYYWSGSFWNGDLTAYDWRKHIHVIGLSDPRDIEQLPIPQNGCSMEYVLRLLPRFLAFLGVVLLSVLLVTWGGGYRKIGQILLIFGILGLFDSHPFKSSAYDPHTGDQGMAPYQELIDYVESKGGMAFWAHPEANFGKSEKAFQKRIAGIDLPEVSMSTGIHPSDLLATHDYTGFESLYGDTIHATDPGKEWDRVLVSYCDGERKKPAWGLCGLDFHEQGRNSWSQLDRGQTVFWVRERTREAVLDAMRNGRMYAVFQGEKAKMHLDTFSLSDKTRAQAAVSGETLQTRGEPVTLELNLSMSDSGAVPVQVEVIGSGRILFTTKGQTPLSISREFFPSRSHGYVRVMVRSKRYRLVTNPIFYRNPTKGSG